MVRHYDYDVVLLSPQLADISGLEVLRRMRHARQATPAFMLGSRISTQAKVAAFSAGADDVLVTPVDPAELLARLQAVVRRSRGISDPVVRVDGLQVNLNTGEVTGTRSRPRTRRRRRPGPGRARYGCAWPGGR